MKGKKKTDTLLKIRVPLEQFGGVFRLFVAVRYIENRKNKQTNKQNTQETFPISFFLNPFDSLVDMTRNIE